MYKFSIPMPFEKNYIDELIRINKSIEKSRITEVYFALPGNSSSASGFEQLRTVYEKITDFDFWKKIICYSLEKGFDFVYLFNTPKSFVAESELLDKQLKKLDDILQNLKKIDCFKLRISNTQLINYIAKNYPEFKIYASTSLEYTQIKQYNLFFSIFPQVTEIVPSFNVNKNFMLLNNLKKAYPDVNIELMVNEGCLAGCPLRIHHNLSIPICFNAKFMSRSIDLSPNLFTYICSNLSQKNFFEEICKSNVIYPWEIDEYAKIGINKFKLVGRNSTNFHKGSYINIYETYLKGVDNYKNIENEEFRKLNHYLQEKDINLKIKEIKPFLPDIKHFIKNGHLCDSSCGVSCRYCYKCADTLKKKFPDTDIKF